MTQIFKCGRYELSLARPVIMGIVNLTDDSFSGDGHMGDAASAIRHGLRQIEEGAGILDLGAESSRPGAASVPAEWQLGRLLPVIRELRDCGVPLSVDTTKPEVMRAALDAGVDMVNDISALRTTGALDVVASTNAGLCLMHMQGDPATMQNSPTYENVVSDVKAFLSSRIAAVMERGVSKQRIVVDPGFCFGKRHEHNLLMLRELGSFLPLGVPLLVGMSRKSMLGTLTGRPPAERGYASVAAHVIAALKGARIIRVHDVAATRDGLAVAQAVEGW